MRLPLAEVGIDDYRDSVQTRVGNRVPADVDWKPTPKQRAPAQDAAKPPPALTGKGKTAEFTSPDNANFQFYRREYKPQRCKLYSFNY